MGVFLFTYVPYFTILVFILGMTYRFYIWVKTPQPGKMTLFPAPTKGFGTFWGMIKESLLFPGLFKGDKVLWSFSWVFHATLLLIIIGHIRVFTDFPALWAALSINADKMSAISGGIAGIIIFATALLLFFRRFVSERVREITNLSDIFALLLILGILLTGNMMRFGEHFDLNLSRDYFTHLLTFSYNGMVVPQSGVFQLHFLLVQLLIMYIPFSKILHFGGIFFTQALIKRS